MARFRATIKGQRGEASRLGSTKSGIVAAINGWKCGIKVAASISPTTGGDVFQVFLTSGSQSPLTEELVYHLELGS